MGFKTSSLAVGLQGGFASRDFTFTKVLLSKAQEQILTSQKHFPTCISDVWC